MNPEHTNGWVRTQQDGAVLTVTLDRPDQLNAQTPATWSALARIGASLDDDVRVVVVRGAGPLLLRRAGPQPVQRRARRRRRSRRPRAAARPPRPRSGSAGTRPGFRWLRSPGIVSVAAVQGHAIGAGCQLALACDLRVLADDAQLRLPEATLGPGARPDRHQHPGRAGRLLAGAGDLPDRPRGRRRRGARDRAGQPRRPGRRAGRRRRRPGRRAAPRRRSDASRATAALVRSAVRNDPDAQDAAERAAQVLRLQELARFRTGSLTHCLRNSPAADRCWPVDGKEAVWTWAIP